jgi:hypothetical protein
MIRYSCPKGPSDCTYCAYDTYVSAREGLGCEYCQDTACSGPVGNIVEGETGRT